MVLEENNRLEKGVIKIPKEFIDGEEIEIIERNFKEDGFYVTSISNYSSHHMYFSIRESNKK